MVEAVEERRLVRLADLDTRGLSLRFPDGTDLVITPDDVIRFLVREGQASREEAVLFLAYCATWGLNPLEDDAYLVKYDEKEPARVVMGKHGWLKLAYRHPLYERHVSGILVRTKEGKVQLREGTFYEKDKEALMGGWAEVYRKDRTPYSKRMLLEEFNTGRKKWRDMPAVMIEKVALSNAIREAFPDLGLGSVLPAEELEGEPEEEEARERRHFWAAATRLGFNGEQVHEVLGVASVKDWLAQGKTFGDALEVLRAKRLEDKPAEGDTPPLPEGRGGVPLPTFKFKTYGEVAEWAYKTLGVGPMRVFADFNIAGWEEFASPQKAAELIQTKYGKPAPPGETGKAVKAAG